MTIKNRGGVFGRNPTFNNVDVDGTLSIAGAAIPAPANTLTTSDIGSTVQAYDADTAKLDAATAAFTGNLSVDADTLYVDAAADEVGINTSTPTGSLYIAGPNTSSLGVAAESAMNIAAASGSLIGRKVNLGFGIVPSAVNCGASIAFEYTSQSGFGKGDIVLGTRDVTTDTAPTEKVRILAGGGITFNGDTAAANALSDYEEGVWTPTDGSGAGLTFIVANGWYTKIGRQVTVNGEVRYPVTANTNNAQIGSLPFTAASAGYSAGSTMGSTAKIVSTFVVPNVSYIQFYEQGVVGWNYLTNAEQSNEYIYFTHTYWVS